MQTGKRCFMPNFDDPTIYYADMQTGAYLGGYAESIEPPPDSLAVPIPPDFSFQVWDGSVWQPTDIPVNPDSAYFIQQAAEDFIANNGPFEVFSIWYPVSMNTQANAAQADGMRKALWARIREQQLPWLTDEYALKMETWAANANMPLV
jgi:hypothetical protein